MTPEEQAREIAHGGTRCQGGNPLRTARGFYDHLPACDGMTASIAAALRAARKAGLEEAAKIASNDEIRASGSLATAKKRYAMRDALSAVGYQGDPDAECIHLEACADTANDIAAAIRALAEREPTT